MPKTFSPATLEKFEAASASIPLRPLTRAFETANIRLGADPGGPDGARRVQFRRYVASVNQRDARQLEELGRALGALIDEVAESKQAYLITAAAGDGFAFASGAFTPAAASEETIDDREKRLDLLANADPNGAIAGATELVESVLRRVTEIDEPPEIRECLEELGAIVARLDGLRGKRIKLLPRHARFAAGAAATLAAFLAETTATKKKR